MRNRQSVFIAAGEPSGDLHASRLLRELQRLRGDVQALGVGGQHLAAAGMEVLDDLASDAVMGIFPVLRALPRLRRSFQRCLDALDTRRPDLLLLVDYPGFNIRLADAAHRRGIPVVWYIPPKVWAWKRGRVNAIRRTVKKVLLILPFEEKVFREAGVPCSYVGSPVVDHWHEHEAQAEIISRLRADAPRVLGLFPGSRSHVRGSLLRPFLEAAAKTTAGTPPWRVLVSGPESARSVVDRAAASAGVEAQLHTGSALDIMHAMDAGLAASGTVTLELALAGKPFAIAYRVSAPVYAAGKLLVRLPYFAPVNLVAEREVVREFIGVRSPAAALAGELARLQAKDSAETMSAALEEVRARLGPVGASARAAAEVAAFLD